MYGNGPVHLCRDALVFGDLGGVARLVHEVAGDDDEGGAEAVDGGHREFVVHGLLREFFVIGEHAELRITELHEEERLGRARGAARSEVPGGECQAGGDGQSLHEGVHNGERLSWSNAGPVSLVCQLQIQPGPSS